MYFRNRGRERITAQRQAIRDRVVNICELTSILTLASGCCAKQSDEHSQPTVRTPRALIAQHLQLSLVYNPLYLTRCAEVYDL